MELLTNSSIFATTNTTSVDYPFGTRTWQIYAGDVKGNFTLNFNGCDDDKHFTSIALMVPASGVNKGDNVCFVVFCYIS